jgi:hypothetical protein
MGAAYFGWMILLTALPLFNRDHQRAGDMIGGTLVISVPKRSLLAELIPDDEAPHFEFSRKQLEIYGAFELQVLEEVLRRPNSDSNDEVLDDIHEKIANKIGWTGKVRRRQKHDFLTAFYTAQRAHLEREQLYGRARPDKSA